MKTRKGRFIKIAEHLWRYSSNKKYYAVFRRAGKVVWTNLQTTDRELATRKLKHQIETADKVEVTANKMTLDQLLKLDEESLGKFDHKTQATRKSILKQLRATWKNGFDVAVRDITTANLDLWLTPHRQRMKKVSFNEYIRVVKHVFQFAVDSRAIADSPAQKFTLYRPETPERNTPNRDQVHALIEHIRSNKFRSVRTRMPQWF